MSRIAVIRADASVKIGGGHIYRCLTLADAMADAGWRCIFASRRGTCEAAPVLGRSRHEIIEIDTQEEATQLGQLYPDGIDLLVVDHYGLDTGFETACRPWARRIMALDDGTGRSHDCDILLDQNLGAQGDAYRDFVPDRCRLLTGPSYALLRPQFHRARREALSRRASGKPVRRLLISLGATDPMNITSRITAAAAGLPLEIDVALGAGSTQQQAIQDIASHFGLKARIHVDVTDMAALMSSADLAFGAGGSTSWERCCLGLPSLIVVLAENQQGIAAALDRAGAVLNLGMANTVTSQELTAALQMLYQDEKKLATMAERAAAICDGEGTRRVMGVLAND